MKKIIDKIKLLFFDDCNSCSCGVNYTTKDKIINNNKIIRKIDKFILNSYFSIPLFFFLLYVIFEFTFTVGGYLSTVIDSFGNEIIKYFGINNIFFLSIWGGIFGLFVYLPNVVILYFFLYLLNDSGILQSFSRRFDKYINKIGITGKGFLSMFLGFGCTVPAILSTNLIEDKKEKIVVIMSLPFISCSAKLPVFVLLVSAFVPNEYQSISLMALYIIGIIIAIIAAKFFSNILKYNACSLKYDLIVYRLPSIKTILSKIYCVLIGFMKKVGIYIIPISAILTLLFSYPGNDIKSSYGYKSLSYANKIFEPIGFNDKMSISIFPGLIGKEIIVSTLGSLYYIDDTSDTSSLIQKLRNDKTITIPGLISFMIFILIYTACISSVIAAYKELGKLWGFIFFIYPILLAYLISFIIYNVLLIIT